MAALRIGAAEPIRRDRPAAGEASRAGGGIGTARAVHPRHRRSGSRGRHWSPACPGSGLSSSIVPAGDSARRSSIRAADIVPLSLTCWPALLDELDIDRVDVVGGSIGDVWALSLAEHHPDRVGRVVLLGGGPHRRRGAACRASSGLFASPIGALIVRLPLSADRLRSILRESGHGASLEDGRIPDEFIEWRLALANDTIVDAPRARHGPRHRPRIRLAAGLHVRRRAARPDRAADAARLRHGRPDRQIRHLAARDRRPAARRAGGDRWGRTPAVVRGREPRRRACSRFLARPTSI